VSDVWETEYMHLFTADGFEGDLTDCDEGVLEWVDISALPVLAQWQGDKIFLGLIAKDAPFFSLKLRYRGEELAYAALNGRQIVPAP